jgi:hypothetical protein
MIGNCFGQQKNMAPIDDGVKAKDEMRPVINRIAARDLEYRGVL